MANGVHDPWRGCVLLVTWLSGQIWKGGVGKQRGGYQEKWWGGRLRKKWGLGLSGKMGGGKEGGGGMGQRYYWVSCTRRRGARLARTCLLVWVLGSSQLHKPKKVGRLPPAR